MIRSPAVDMREFDPFKKKEASELRAAWTHTAQAIGDKECKQLRTKRQLAVDDRSCPDPGHCSAG